MYDLQAWLEAELATFGPQVAEQLSTTIYSPGPATVPPAPKDLASFTLAPIDEALSFMTMSPSNCRVTTGSRRLLRGQDVNTTNPPFLLDYK